MNHLLRDLAPISSTAWEAIEDEAKEQLATHLAGRRVVDWSGPHGWDHSATNIGRQRKLSADGETRLRQRVVLPLAELRVPFTVTRAELEDADRGRQDLDFDDLDAAAARIALLENRAIFHGWEEPGFVGMTQASSHAAMTLGDDPEKYPAVVANAVDTLREAGAKGPYAVAIGPEGHTRIMETTEHGGYLLLDHLRRVLSGGKVVRATGVVGAVVFNLTGGDFVFDVGQDVSIGYSHHDADAVTLYFEESFSFHVTEPDAAIALT